MGSNNYKFVDTIQLLGSVEAKNKAKEIALSEGFNWDIRADVIFKASCIEELSPNFKGKTDTHDKVLNKWVHNFFGDYNNRPSLRESKVPSTYHDDALDILIQSRLPHLSIKDLESIKWAHRLAMSAENIFGSILEEYLAVRLEQHGWYWATGSVVKAVDFVSDEGELLQIKSRNNTENSSSNKIRNGTTIKKWWRFHATKGITNWPALNSTLNVNTFSEKDYLHFVRKLISNNTKALAVESGNSWHNLMHPSIKKMA